MKYLLFLILFPVAVVAQKTKGRFVGDVVAQWLDNGRSMKLNKEFGYIDPNGKKWDVPKNTIVDGASIPQIFWTIIGGPFEGTYRNASVVHDYYCVVKTEDWKDVHLMFYNACLTGGTNLIKAKIMYAAVYAGGPRWRIDMSKSHGGNSVKMMAQRAIVSEDKLTEINKWIEKNNPSLEDINNKLDKIVVVEDKVLKL
ncbi:DUF1353 domain-containing protein [Mucilaginibacter terrigena]|uniref:DUF1353 domain-containing protein n=1 Tax=Mucilaginibacter terrigena TaxID=2492395 RepID=A0A4Q5LK60_9SPHI|nr:DUF1353 domain-containing protein [Mucilaginibacter terrigena]RYU87834.1 DUF1353 domain-containing protein [Mucilaginibacter terrigena]